MNLFLEDGFLIHTVISSFLLREFFYSALFSKISDVFTTQNGKKKFRFHVQ